MRLSRCRPGEWRIPAGELNGAFAVVEGFEILDAHEADGVSRSLGSGLPGRLAGWRRVNRSKSQEPGRT